jgi:chromosome segregation ATPase
LKAAADQIAQAERRIENLLRERTDTTDLYLRIADLEKKNEQLQHIAQQIARSEQSAREIKTETERVRHFAAQQKVRAGFSRMIAAHQKTIIDHISQLHSALTGASSPMLRPILLACVFLQRWRRTANLTSFDPSSLVAFASVSDKTIDSKLGAIRGLFVSLSDELKTAKERLLEQRPLNTQLLPREADAAPIALYKRRIRELVAQSAELVAADRFEEVVTHATDVELENDQLREAVDTKQMEIEHQAEAIQKLTRDLAKAQLRHEADQKEVGRFTATLEQRQTQIAVLRTKLHDRTKDLLALERMNDYKPAGAAAAPEDDPALAFVTINPLFLGADQNAVQ